jgi:hypothetical protein
LRPRTAGGKLEVRGYIGISLFGRSQIWNRLPDDALTAQPAATKGLEVGLLFLFFHKRLCGPLANSRFHHQPDARNRPDSRLEAAYHRADAAIQKVVDLLAAA